MSNERAIAVAQAQVDAARAQLRATLLAAPADVRGCDVPDCPGPRASSSGGCPLGYAGSCRRRR